MPPPGVDEEFGEEGEGEADDEDEVEGEEGEQGTSGSVHVHDPENGVL